MQNCTDGSCDLGHCGHCGGHLNYGFGICWDCSVLVEEQERRNWEMEQDWEMEQALAKVRDR